MGAQRVNRDVRRRPLRFALQSNQSALCGAAEAALSEISQGRPPKPSAARPLTLPNGGPDFNLTT
jgi:hypothetical protein